MASSAPSSVTKRFLSAPEMGVATRAPCSLASWMAIWPTPPAPAWISTCCCALISARSCSASQAVSSTSGAAAVAEIHRIARLVILHLRADRFHYAGAVASEDGGHALGKISAARTELGIERIDAGGLESHQQFAAGGEDRGRNFLESQYVGRAGRGHHYGFHRSSSISARSAARQPIT